MLPCIINLSIFFFNDTATTEIYTLSLHDALPILHRGGNGNADAGNASPLGSDHVCNHRAGRLQGNGAVRSRGQDRKSTRLNSSHSQISYAVFCLKKKKKTTQHITITSSSTFRRYT